MLSFMPQAQTSWECEPRLTIWSHCEPMPPKNCWCSYKRLYLLCRFRPYFSSCRLLCLADLQHSSCKDDRMRILLTRRRMATTTRKKRIPRMVVRQHCRHWCCWYSSFQELLLLFFPCCVESVWGKGMHMSPSSQSINLVHSKVQAEKCRFGQMLLFIW